MGRNSSGFKSRKSEKRTEISVFRVFSSGRIFGIPTRDCTTGKPKKSFILRQQAKVNLSSFEPAADAVKVKGVIAHAPGHVAFFRSRGRLISLAFNAKIF